MLAWQISLGVLVMIPWVLLLVFLSLKYIFKKPIVKQWKIFFITLGADYAGLIIIGVVIFLAAPSLF